MISSNEFKQSMARFASGITVLTWYEDQSIQGITVSAFSSLSLEPPLVLFCIDHKAYVHPLISARETLCINILSADQTSLAYQFAGPDRTNLDQHTQQHPDFSLPTIKDAHANLIVRIRDCHRQGDHDIFIAEVLDTHLPEASEPLFYHDGRIFNLTQS